MLKRLKEFFNNRRIEAYQEKYEGLYAHDAEKGTHYWDGVELPAMPKILDLTGEDKTPFYWVEVRDPIDPPHKHMLPLPILEIQYPVADMPFYLWRGDQLPGKPEITSNEEGGFNVIVCDPKDPEAIIYARYERKDGIVSGIIDNRPDSSVLDDSFDM